MDESLKGVHVDTQFARRAGDKPEKCRHIIIIVSEIGYLCSDTVACNLCFSVDLDMATFIFPSALNIESGFAGNSKANTSLKLISREHASRPITCVQTSSLSTNKWFFFTSISFPRVQYNESSHPNLKFPAARCPMLTALSALPSGCAICRGQCSRVIHLGDRHNAKGQHKHQVCRGMLWWSAWSVLIRPSASSLWRVWWLTCSVLLNDRTICDSSPLRAKLRAHFTIWW